MLQTHAAVPTPVERIVDQRPTRERSKTADLAPRVSAIVVTHETGQPLELCLRSALAEPWIDELLIVDGGNPPEVSSALRALQADRRDVKLIQGQGDLGPAAACNLAAAQARGRWLMFLDPHVVLQRGAAQRLAAAGGGTRAPWIAGGRLTDTQGRDKPAARAGALNFWSALAVALDWPSAPKLKRSKRRNAAPSEPTRVASVSAAFMLTPRADFEQLGGFDEGFSNFAADLDLCRRASEAGGAVLFQPAASGVQFSGSGLGKRRQAQGLARFAAKSAKTPFERGVAMIASPSLALIMALRDFVIGIPPKRRARKAKAG